jgi:hypothetical protein
MGSFTTAFAAGDAIENGTEDAPVDAIITKILQMPEGTSKPKADFTFNVEKVSKDDENDTETLENMPTITGDSKLKISFDRNETYSAHGVLANTLTSKKNAPSSLFPAGTFTSAGVYVYEVTEVTGSSSVDGGTMTYSTAKYTLTVYVENGTKGAYVESISALVDATDNSTANGGDKVDPTPAAGNMVFTNIYVKTITDVDPTDGGLLEISNAVDGKYADQSIYFPYEATITKPASVSGTPVYKGYVVSGNVVVTDAENSSVLKSDSVGGYIEFTSGQNVQFNLKHGQTLVFIDTPVGTTWTATDKLGADVLAKYTPTVIITEDGQNITPAPTANQGNPLSTGSRLLGEATNKADFTNTRETILPTGITMNNMPYYALVLMSLAALALFIVVQIRRKKRNAYDNY